MDCGANVLCINMDVATNCPLPMVSCNTHIKTFGDNKVSVIAKISNHPMTFGKGTEWEVTIRCTALVYNTGTTWEILSGMPVVNHYAVYLWPCAFLGGVVMFPSGQHQLQVHPQPATQRALQAPRSHGHPASSHDRI